MAITISGENNNDRILAQDGVIDQISGINIVGLLTAGHLNVGSNIQLGNAGIITATTFVGNLTGNVNSTSPLLLQTGGSERFRITGNNELGIAGANYGTSGQVLTSGGSGNAVTWSTITSTTINNNADNRLITGSGTANTLEGESNLTYDGTNLQLITDANNEGIKLNSTSTGSSYPVFEMNANRSVGNTLGKLISKWNGTEVASIQFSSGTDGTNKDDAHIHFNTASAGTAIERLRIHSNGIVTIGDDNTGAGTLGADLAVANVAGANIVVGDTVSGEYLKLKGTSGAAWVGSKSNHPLIFFTNGESNERVRITSTGSVRIGGSTNSSFSAHAAADDLVIGATSGSNGMTILTGSATGNIFFNDGSGNDGVVQYVHSSSPNYFRIASSGHIRFDAAAISISDDNIAPTAGDMASGASFGIPRLHMRGDNSQSGAYELMARFQSGTDANDSGATIVLNHSNDRGLALQGGRGQSNRSFGAIKAIDNLGRLSTCIDFLGGNGQGVNRISFYTGESTTTEERLRIDSSGNVMINNTNAATQYAECRDLVIGNTSGSHGMTIISQSNNLGRIMWSDTYTAGTGTYEGQILYNHAAETLNFYANYTNNTNVAMQLGGNQNQLFVGIDKGGTTTFDNRSAYFHRTTGNSNFISITTGASSNCGIVFGDSIGNNGGNYETYIMHENSTNDLWFRANQGSDNRHLKLKSTGNVEIGNGDLVMASGHGIDFAAAADVGSGETVSTSVLRDYEEGTFTPTLYYGTGTSEPSYSWRYGNYIKVGRQVTAWFALGITGFSASYSQAWIGGLPFQLNDPSALWKYLNHMMGYSYASGWGDGGSDKHMFLAIYDNQTKMMINHEGNHLSTGNIGSGQRFSCTVTYQTD